MKCLDENAVAILFEESLPDSERAAIDEHVAACGRCRVLVATYAEAFTAAASVPAITLPHSDLPAGHSIVARLIAERSALRRIGTTLRGKWTLDALLGIGGMGCVYAASHRNGKRVAIKILKPEWAAQPEIVRRFLREGYVANRIGHPGAVSILDDDITDDGAPFLVMDLLEGEGLGRRLGRGPAEDHAAPFTVSEVLDVLVEAHAAGIIHRDLKPDNLFLTNDGLVKVLDFGTARLQEIGGEPFDTQSGVLMGTPSFMPPEQARGLWDEVDGRSDLWALGATMYTWLTGQHVRSAKTTNHELFRAMTEPVPSILVARPDVPRACARIIDRALAFDAKDRWADADAMRVAVREARESPEAVETAPAPQDGEHGAMAPRSSARARWRRVGRVVVVALGLGALGRHLGSANAPVPATSAAADTEARPMAAVSAVSQEPARPADEASASGVSMPVRDGPDASARTNPRPPRSKPEASRPQLGPSLPPSPSAASSDYLDRRY
jgi:serine/threonine-protein kinase